MPDLMLPSEHRARSLTTLKTQMELREAQAKAEAAVAARQRETRMRQLFDEQGPALAAGDENALGALSRFDPAAAQELGGKAAANRESGTRADKAAFDFDEGKREAAQKRLDRIGMALTAVLAAAPEVRGIMYQRQRRALAAEGMDISQTPDEYDANWVRTKASELQTMSERLAQMKAEQPEKPERVPLRAVYDANSPTKQRLVPETEAAGLPTGTPAAPERAPLGTIVNVKTPDGKTRGYRTTDPRLDAALEAGGVVIRGTAGTDELDAEAPEDVVPSGAFNPATGPSDPTLTTGYWGPLVQGANAAADFFGSGPFDAETMKAGQELRQLDIETRTMLQEAIPGRPSNYLLQELDSMVAKAGGGGGPAAMRQRLALTRDYLGRVMGQVQAFKPTTKAQTDKRSQNLLRLQGLVRAYDQMIAAGGGAPNAAESEEDALIRKWGGGTTGGRF